MHMQFTIVIVLHALLTTLYIHDNDIIMLNPDPIHN